VLRFWGAWEKYSGRINWSRRPYFSWLRSRLILRRHGDHHSREANSRGPSDRSHHDSSTRHWHMDTSSNTIAVVENHEESDELGRDLFAPIQLPSQSHHNLVTREAVSECAVVATSTTAFGLCHGSISLSGGGRVNIARFRAGSPSTLSTGLLGRRPVSWSRMTTSAPRNI